MPGKQQRSTEEVQDMSSDVLNTFAVAVMENIFVDGFGTTNSDDDDDADCCSVRWTGVPFTAQEPETIEECLDECEKVKLLCERVC